MAQHVPLSTSKGVLMQALGLTPGNRGHEELYVAIKVILISATAASMTMD